MSYVRIWVHVVFSTKYREPLLSHEVRYKVQKHIMQNCREKEIHLQAINGYHEHLHCLLSLGKQQTIAWVVQQIKGNSSHWINKEKLIDKEFAWQDDYFAVSVSESQLERVTKYIKNQETHHSKKSFENEVNQFMVKYGWSRVLDEKNL